MESCFTFTTPLNYNIVETKSGDDLYIEGLISTSDTDLVNDIVSKACLESMQSQVLNGNIKLDLEHEAFRGNNQEEKELNKTLIPAGRITDATITPKGLRVKAIINKFNKRFNEIKGNIENRFLDAFSIAFIPTRASQITKSGEKIRVLEDVRLLNVALTGNPVNTQAQITEIFTKSANMINEKVLSVNSETLEEKEEITEIDEYKEEKKENPAIENMLEVKDSHSTLKGNKLIKLKEKNKMDTKDNVEEVIEQPEDVSEPEAQAKEEVTESAKVEEAKEEAPAEPEAEVEGPVSEIKSKMEALEKELLEIKSQLAEKKAIHKARVEQQEVKDIPKESHISPLDLIK